jgi:ubiquinone/menaquinone biosynthesis C-methylase UbiE
MTSINTSSAQFWGRLWGTLPSEWAVVEEAQLPTYETAIERLGIGEGQLVLDLGCGSGVFLRAAADRGAQVAGLDAAEGLLEIARRRVPEAVLLAGDMQELPFADDTFDVVTAFSSLFFADDMTRALSEARRVCKPGGTVLAQVFGRPERCSLEVLKSAILPLVGLEGDEPEYWRFDKLEQVARDAGLTPLESFYSSWAYEFADDPELLSAMLSAGSAVAAVEHAGREIVVEAILGALAPYRDADGSYRMPNEWHFLVARCDTR